MTTPAIDPVLAAQQQTKRDQQTAGNWRGYQAWKPPTQNDAAKRSVTRAWAESLAKAWNSGKPVTVQTMGGGVGASVTDEDNLDRIWLGDKVLLPNSARDLAAAVGIIIHELGHLHYTYKMSDRFTQELKARGLFRTANMVEDAKQEMKMLKLRPGYEKYLRHAVLKHLLETADPNSLHLIYPLIAGRTYLPASLIAKSRTFMVMAYGEDVVAEFDYLLSEWFFVNPIDDPNEGLRIIQDIHDLLKGMEGGCGGEPTNGSTKKDPEGWNPFPQPGKKPQKSKDSKNKKPDKGDQKDPANKGKPDDSDDKESKGEGHDEGGDGEGEEPDTEPGEDEGKGNAKSERPDFGQSEDDEDDDFDEDFDDDFGDPNEDDESEDGKDGDGGDEGGDSDGDDGDSEGEDGGDGTDGGSSQSAGGNGAGKTGQQVIRELPPEPQQVDPDEAKDFLEKIKKTAEQIIDQIAEDYEEEFELIKSEAFGDGNIRRPSDLERIIQRDLAGALKQLADKARSGIDRRKPRGRLHVGRFIRNSDRVGVEKIAFDKFRPNVQQALDMEITLLVDNSGSVGGMTEEMAGTLWALVTAMESVGGPSVTVILWNSDFRVWKVPTDKWKTKYVPRFEAMGGTDPHSVLKFAAAIFKNTRRKHRLNFILTDGMWSNMPGAKQVILGMRAANEVDTYIIGFGGFSPTNIEEYGAIAGSAGGIATITEFIWTIVTDRIQANMQV